MRPTILFHVQHFMGMGHLVRAFALADALAAHFRVVIASGGRFPAGMEIPASVEVEHLPPLGFDAGRMLVSLVPGATVDEVVAHRRHQLSTLEDRLRPDVLLLELFPFGRKKLAPELLALLEQVAGRPSPPLVATSVRDLLVTGRHDQQRHDDRAAAIAERFIDLVLVHGDPGLAPLSESFRPSRPFAVPVVYTGFVARPRPAQPPSELAPGTIMVSAGGGWVGSTLMHAALDAAPILARRHGCDTTLITGPLADGDEQRSLAGRARQFPMATVVASVPALEPALRTAAVSVSQAGYNTTVDVLGARVPAVLVPFGDARENEQTRRAALLAAHGVATVVDPTRATGPVLADAVSSVLGPRPPGSPWSLDGAHRTVEELGRALEAHRAQGRGAVAG